MPNKSNAILTKLFERLCSHNLRCSQAKMKTRVWRGLVLTGSRVVLTGSTQQTPGPGESVTWGGRTLSWFLHIPAMHHRPTLQVKCPISYQLLHQQHHVASGSLLQSFKRGLKDGLQRSSSEIRHVKHLLSTPVSSSSQAGCRSRGERRSVSLSNQTLGNPL